jgi:hypothetical protein
MEVSMIVIQLFNNFNGGIFLAKLWSLLNRPIQAVQPLVFAV